MRIYTRDAFLILPPGTLFCKGKPWYFGGIAVKGASCANDFFARDLCWIETNPDIDPFDRLDAMAEHGTSVPMQTAEGRDGCFDDQDLFLVYEADDLQALGIVMQVAREVGRPVAMRD